MVAMQLATSLPLRRHSASATAKSRADADFGSCTRADSGAIAVAVARSVAACSASYGICWCLQPVWTFLRFRPRCGHLKLVHRGIVQ